MYAKTCGAMGTGGCATLAYTGLSVLHYIVAAFTLLVLGVALLHVIPKKEA